jgi:heme-degrading monooxygenase HmoA
MKNVMREVTAAVVLSFVVAVPGVITVRAQSAQNGLPDFVNALKTTPGVLGVELAQTMSGKNVIFAWFENKQAVLKWYYSDTHQALMMQFGANRRPSGPLADVPDDGRPVLAIASVTLTGAPPTNAAELKTVPQIAIELYAPLPGGLAVGGRFAPSTVHVPGMVEVPAHPTAQ